MTRAPASRPSQAGFTLLEVMIAVVILAVGLAALFTSEAGAMKLAQRARTTTIATLLARCKMAEIEEKVAKEGWPDELDERDECCEDAEHEGFRCEWKVQRVKLPDLEQEQDDEDDDSERSAGAPSNKGTGVLDKLAGLAGGEDAVSGVTELIANPGAAGGDDELSGSTLDPVSAMVMELAFPAVKPVIEEGVRRATVNVKWNEGQREQSFELVQFLVSEEQIILPEEDEDAGTPSGTGASPTSGANTSNTNPSTTPGNSR